MNQRKTGFFHINGKKKELPLFQSGDRVYLLPHSTTAAEPVEGTVQSTSNGGLFVDVKWDKEYYASAIEESSRVWVGSNVMADNINYIKEDVSDGK